MNYVVLVIDTKRYYSVRNTIEILLVFPAATMFHNWLLAGLAVMTQSTEKLPGFAQAQLRGHGVRNTGVGRKRFNSTYSP